MSSELILHIETATDICSVALSEGDRVISLAESDEERSHARLLNGFIKQVLEEAGKEMKDLQAVAVSKGPGSYTGLRIGVSTAKGIAYALNIPLMACGTLENMAHGALLNSEVQKHLKDGEKLPLLLCPMIDARRMEVYSSFYDEDLNMVREVAADIIDENSYGDVLNKQRLIFFGNGSDKCREMITHPNALFINGLSPGAAHMCQPVLKRFREGLKEDVAYFEPFYLKDFIATTPKKKVL